LAAHEVAGERAVRLGRAARPAGDRALAAVADHDRADLVGERGGLRRDLYEPRVRYRAGVEDLLQALARLDGREHRVGGLVRRDVGDRAGEILFADAPVEE